MLVVRIELHSARTGKVSEIGRMVIANDGVATSKDPRRGSYTVKIGRKGHDLNAAIWKRPQREARVEDYPRQSYTVWELVRRALNAVYGKRQQADGEG